MTAGDYRIVVKIDAWTATINRRQQTDPAADAITMEPLTAAWAMQGDYPSQPSPTTVTFGLYVPDIATGPVPAQGSRVEITITTPDHNPALTGIRPVFEFVGLITDIDASPLEDGLAFSIVATDYTSTLGEERIGSEPWIDQSTKNRLQLILALSKLPFTYDGSLEATAIGLELGPYLAARDVDSQQTRQLLEDLFNTASHWAGGFSPTYWTLGYVGGPPFFAAPPLVTWMRPAVGQSVDALGNLTFPIVILPGGLPDDPMALPYQASLVGGKLAVTRKAGVPTTSLIAWIPAAAIEAESVTWRQDKAGNVNRLRGTGTTFAHAGVLTGELVDEYADLVAANGPVEIAVDFAAATVFTDPGTQALQTGWMHDVLMLQLGTHYDASPRWALDTVKIRAEKIAAGDQWPRLFNPREHTHIYDQAAGRFVLITDVAARWNLHDRADYFGRLTAATLDLSNGRISWTATLAHRLPVGGGLEGTTTPVHSPITYAELAAGPNPTYANAGALTYADLELVEG